MEKVITQKKFEQMLTTLVSREKIDGDNAKKQTERLKKLKAKGKEEVKDEDIRFYAGREAQAGWTYSDIRELCGIYNLNWDKIKKIIL